MVGLSSQGRQIDSHGLQAGSERREWRLVQPLRTGQVPHRSEEAVVQVVVAMPLVAGALKGATPRLIPASLLPRAPAQVLKAQLGLTCPLPVPAATPNNPGFPIWSASSSPLALGGNRRPWVPEFEQGHQR